MSTLLWHWPRTLGSRLFLILLAGLLFAHLLSFAVLFSERYMSARQVMLGTLETDVATSVAILDRLPAAERPQWLPRVNRGNYQYILGPGLPGVPEMTQRGKDIAERIMEASGGRFPVTMQSIPGDGKRMQAHLTLSDGNPLTIDVHPRMTPIAEWLPYVLVLQLLLLITCCWFAVRLAIRPLVALADAADALNPNAKSPPLDENGPTELARAARAFNALSDRIAHFVAERVQILAAISHDLQTPITRMKLRAEMAEDSEERRKMVNDLTEIQKLVQEGLAYARTTNGEGEKASRIDLGSLVESLVYDYQDTGKAVSITENAGGALMTRPNALRRVLTNLIDNAIKYGGGAAELSVRRDQHAVVIEVMDRGAGIPEDKLEAVLQPFVRLEESRNRETGGTGLGLAIAHQLAVAVGGSLKLRNRESGGLVAEIRIA
ncbi:ATP-binding region, ATPase-like:Histidine kinase, HAMP region:Histidine kinase A, N-terminal (plasmid) [Cupriavidus taiwanensis]|uniref:histidine kinase n=1 Tax=Cupriavidus taiwanensis TaxID=164546 RepID=A0A375IRL2_9BURK|nr:ATP-binding protein [Cupriavidus taiwanensis]SPK76092.1 ATP-binding region, ATPase-like:Histidine kinase, HAMP region:Histidine kinase A, N-terminal [Cupriavidus taiwanensis]